MKKIHASLIAAATLILILSLVYGALNLYSRQSTLPKGTQLAGWEIGGLDRDEVRSQLEEHLLNLHSITLVLMTENNAGFKLTMKDAGITYETEPFLQGLQSLSQGSLIERVKARRDFSPSWDLNTRLDIHMLQNLLNPDWEKKTFGTPVNATRRITADDRVVYTPEISSRQVDWPAMEQSLHAVIPKDLSQLEQLGSKVITLKVPLVILQPPVTLKSLEKEGIERKITEFSTSLGASGPGRSYNVEAAAKAVNETILPPGGIFDYGKAIQKAKKEYGFREAPVIVNGKLQPGTGGGICQVSSTLYNAALRSGLEIVERHNHSLPVSYLPKGQDATFAEGYINFRFRNNTGKYLIIKSTVQNRRLTVKLFGTFPKNVSYKVESKIIDILIPADRIVNDLSLPPGTSRVLESGKAGYVVETYITRLVDGQPVEKKTLSRDVYRAQKRIILMNKAGTSSTVLPEVSKRPLLEDGVSSE
ncbi:VanW family protein [Paenibacillus wynnii]|uniref:VanW family protein n=1 Tax=Paenibacillus wynnii TaxID=268407 RepID=UPI002794A8AE|nr:VanW family protein [Paenibacillus wynnii]MDQ0192148.1 vancomycin resistance protein YoaR [Paenibacillus wynnii]